MYSQIESETYCWTLIAPLLKSEHVLLGPVACFVAAIAFGGTRDCSFPPQVPNIDAKSLKNG